MAASMAASAAGLHVGHALAATGTAAGTAGGLFSYNRANFMFDAGLRFERFCSARELACAQTAQYRKDIRKLTELTTIKMHCIADSAALMLALCIALYCAGRLGLHGASPPAWIINLWYVNTASSFCWMGLTIWLGFHACFRAKVASVHLLTRKVRVPVPTMAQLDKARRLASEFEQQNWSDLFRVPYLMNNGAPPEKMKDDPVPRGAEKGRGSSSARATSTPPARGGGRMSKATSWVREEWETTRAGTVMGPTAVFEDLPRDAAPEHFRLYAQVQQEWWPYEVYSRVCLSIGVMCYVQGLAYYGLGHINVELRAFWVAYSVAFILCVLHVLILKFDIVDGRKKKERLKHFQWCGPLAVLPATIAMSLDFKTEYQEGAVIMCFILQFVAYILQILYTIRLLELVLPDEVTVKQQIGSPWWPDNWKVPSAFQHVLYLVAPPTKLAPGQHDLVRDLRTGDEGVYATDPAAPSVSLKSQVEYLERVFDKVFADEVFMGRLSKPSQQEVQDLHTSFEKARKAGPGASLDQVVTKTLADINAVLVKEGMQALSAVETTAEPDNHMGHAVPSILKMRQVQPWKCVAAMVSTMIGAYCFCLFGVFLESIIGEQALVTAPHWSRPPMTRPSMDPHELGTPIGLSGMPGEDPYLPDHLVWHEEKRGIDVQHIGRASGYPDGGLSPDRRLRDFHVTSPAKSSRASPARVQGDYFTSLLRSLVEAIPSPEAATQLLERVPTFTEVSALDLARARAAKPSAVPLPVSWPSFFQPRLLVCAPPSATGLHRVAALTAHGFGATATLGGPLPAGGDEVEASSFRLAGISALPPLAGASWDGDDGLLVMSREGHVRSCPGPMPAGGGRWACGGQGSPDLLLGEGARLSAAALARLRGTMHAAIVDERSPDVVSLFVQEAAAGGPASWVPLGDVSVPLKADGSAARVSLSFVDDSDILIAAEDGKVVRRRVADGSVLPSLPHEGQGTWQASCGLHHAGSTAHLYLRQSGDALKPQLLLMNETIAAFGQGQPTLLYQ